eukprot:1088649-Prymnesium_polylepis.1
MVAAALLVAAGRNAAPSVRPAGALFPDREVLALPRVHILPLPDALAPEQLLACFYAESGGRHPADDDCDGCDSHAAIETAQHASDVLLEAGFRELGVSEAAAADVIFVPFLGSVSVGLKNECQGLSHVARIQTLLSTLPSLPLFQHRNASFVFPFSRWQMAAGIL